MSHHAATAGTARTPSARGRTGPADLATAPPCAGSHRSAAVSDAWAGALTSFPWAAKVPASPTIRTSHPAAGTPTRPMREHSRPGHCTCSACARWVLRCLTSGPTRPHTATARPTSWSSHSDRTTPASTRRGPSYAASSAAGTSASTHPLANARAASIAAGGSAPSVLLHADVVDHAAQPGQRAMLGVPRGTFGHAEGLGDLRSRQADGDPQGDDLLSERGSTPAETAYCGWSGLRWRTIRRVGRPLAGPPRIAVARRTDRPGVAVRPPRTP
jgi:hypothetical protein